MNTKYIVRRLFSGKSGYLVTVLILSILLIGGCFSFALFTTEFEKRGALNIEVGNLHSLIDSKEFNDKKQVSVPAGTTKIFEMNLTNINAIDAKFNLYYSSLNDLTNVTVEYRTTGDAAPDMLGYVIDDFNSGNQTKKIIIKIVNSSISDVVIEFGSNVGLSDKELLFPSGKHPIREEVIPILRTRDSYLSTETFYAYAASITQITFHNSVNIPTDGSVIAQWDVSESGNGGVQAYIIDDGLGTNTYHLYITSSEKLFLSSGSCLFYNFPKLLSINNLNLVDTSKITDVHSMFEKSSSLTTLDLSSFDMSSVVSMSNMFADCSSLTSLDLSNFDNNGAISLNFMFKNCSSLINLNLSNFDTSNAITMGAMFEGCTSLVNIDLSSLDTSNVTSMGTMFKNCSSLTSLDLSSFDATSLESMNAMFSGCSSLLTVHFGNLDTSNVNDMLYMFDGCKNLTTLDLSNFNTNKVTRMGYMFRNCSNLTMLDLTSFDTSSVTTMTYMFSRTTKLTQIKVSTGKWVMAANINSMFASSGVNAVTYVS